jgi:ABC-2 type transport system permease protein
VTFVPTISPPSTVLGKVGRAAGDSWVIALRGLTTFVNQPLQIFLTLLFPIMFVVLFGYVFGSGMTVAGGGDYREFLMPGLFVFTVASGIGETMVAVNSDSAKGVMDRFRSMPMSPSAVVVGRNTADMISSSIQLAVMIGCGLVVGWRAHNGIASTFAAIGLLLLLRFAFLWIGIYIGLLVRSPEMAANLWSLLFPITMLTNSFVSPELMPSWLGAIAEWNPLSATISATRELFGNPGGVVADGFTTRNALPLAIAWPIVLTLIFLPLSVRRFQRLSR